LTDFQTEFKKMRDLYLSGAVLREKRELKQRLTSRPIALYGLGFFGGVIVKNFASEGITAECFCDSKKTGVDGETGLRIVTPRELRTDYADANIVVSVANPHNESSVRETVKSLGFDDARIFGFKDAYRFIKKSRVEWVSLPLSEVEALAEGFEWAYGFFGDERSRGILLEIVRGYLFNTTFDHEPPQEAYFPDAFRLGDDEVFIDGGLYTGDTAEAFIKRVGGRYRRVIGFDIDEGNLSAARRNLRQYRDVEIVSEGLWSRSARLRAELGIAAGSNVNEAASEPVGLTSLDEFFSDRPAREYPSFIKLDVEGSEKEALAGARGIIREARPKLAVCAYHKPEDVFALTKLIYELNPAYRFFLRHYSPYVWDTVLYACEPGGISAIDEKERQSCRNR
jgi:FkbM family methyltransferase